jgi:hypothetical protein
MGADARRIERAIELLRDERSQLESQIAAGFDGALSLQLDKLIACGELLTEYIDVERKRRS